MKKCWLSLAVILLFISESSFANSDQTFTSCDDYEIYKDLMDQDLLTPNLIAVTKTMGRICESNSNANFSIRVLPEVAKKKKEKTKKIQVKVNTDGTYQNNSSGEFFLVSTSIEVATLINELGRFTLNISGQIKKNSDDILKEGSISVQRDRLVQDERASVFAVVQVSKSDPKKQKIIAMGLIGYSYDFGGDYYGKNDGGTAFKLSTSIGVQYSDVDDFNDTEIVSRTRLKIIKAITETIKVEFVAWFQTSAYSRVYGSSSWSDFETQEELILKFKQDRIAEFFGGGSDFNFVIKFSHNYNNKTAEDVDNNDVRVTFGIEYLW